MRPALLLTLLLSSACVTGSALAQQGSNWIDPPAKSDPAAGRARTKDAEASAPKTTPKTAPKTAAKPARPEAEPEAPHRAAASRRETRHGDRARAAEMRRARRDAIRERAREQGRAARIDRPAPPAASMARGEPDARFSDWAVAARRLSLDYLDSVSAPNGAMLADAPRFYGPQVRFFGRTMSLGALMAEKRSFVRRWPERRYEPQGEPKVACDGASATCQVRVVHGFTAASPARGARSQGLAELTLTVSFAGGRPVIVSESSRVLSRAGA